MGRPSGHYGEAIAYTAIDIGGTPRQTWRAFGFTSAGREPALIAEFSTYEPTPRLGSIDVWYTHTFATAYHEVSELTDQGPSSHSWNLALVAVNEG